MMHQIQVKNGFQDKISIAPMLDWTDRHFRFWMRLISQQAVLYTEMIACPAILLGDREKLLGFSPSVEEPLVLQIGGSNPKLMGQAARIAAEYGYRALNMNAGCPSSRVQSGQFGAVLMKTPEIVADCVAEMKALSGLPVSVKTRISLLEMSGRGSDHLCRFAEYVHKAGCAHLIVHARQARLNWSPKDNRTRLPLDYQAVYDLKKSFPDMAVSLNGNVCSLDAVREHLKYVDGVMIGRWAYANPYALAEIDALFYGKKHPILSRVKILQKMIPYLEQNQERLSVICPHMMGLFYGQPHAKNYKQILAAHDLKGLKDFVARLKNGD